MVLGLNEVPPQEPAISATITGPQLRGTGGTLTWVGTGHRDRGHPPFSAVESRFSVSPRPFHLNWPEVPPTVRPDPLIARCRDE